MSRHGAIALVLFLSATAQAASGLISPPKDTILEEAFTGEALFDDTLRWINTTADTQTIDSLVPTVKTADANRCDIRFWSVQTGVPGWRSAVADGVRAPSQNDTLSFTSGFYQLVPLAPGDTLIMFEFSFDWCTRCLEWPVYENWQEGDVVTAPLVFHSSAGRDTLTIKAYWGGDGSRFASKVPDVGRLRLQSAQGSRTPDARRVFDACGRKAKPHVPARIVLLRQGQAHGRSDKSLSVGGNK